MKVGFIGLGIMGKPMAKHLIQAGFETYLLDLNQEVVRELAEIGGNPCTSYKEMAESAKFIITMLPTAQHVESVLFDEEGIAEHGAPHTVIINMSSVASNEAEFLAEKLKEYDMFLLDAPVSGGEPKAVSGELSIMVGGDEGIFQRALPILKTMGTDVTHVGEVGDGSTVKLANQIIVNTNIAALSEAVVLATKSGIDLHKMFRAIRGGLAGSAVMEAKMPKMIERDFEPGGRIDINLKDLRNVLSAADDAGVPLPITTQVKQIFHSEMIHGNQDKDHSYIINYYEKLANIQEGKDE